MLFLAGLEPFKDATVIRAGEEGVESSVVGRASAAVFGGDEDISCIYFNDEGFTMLTDLAAPGREHFGVVFTRRLHDASDRELFAHRGDCGNGVHFLRRVGFDIHGMVVVVL